MIKALKLAIDAGTLCAIFTPSAADLVWDGKSYLNIGLRLGADTPIVFPEPVEVSAENDTAFERAESSTDARIMAIRPLSAQEQRVTFVGKPPDEPAMLGLALNELFVPLLQRQYPEITDFYRPPEGCSYRMAVVIIKKSYPGHARRVMFDIWMFSAPVHVHQVHRGGR